MNALRGLGANQLTFYHPNYPEDRAILQDRSSHRRLMPCFV